MKTLSVKLSDGLDAKLAAAARRRKTSKSVVARRALELMLRESGRSTVGSALDLVGDLVGCVAGPTDLSVNKRYVKTFGR